MVRYDMLITGHAFSDSEIGNACGNRNEYDISTECMPVNAEEEESVST
jgi:hypothetical protein